MANSSGITESQPAPRRPWPVLIAGVNAWFCGAGFPWLFLDEPSLLQTLMHTLPLSVLLFGLGALIWHPTDTFVTSIVGPGLVTGFPISIGMSMAFRDQLDNPVSLPAWALLLCVLSLWVFVGAVTGEVRGAAPSSTQTPPIGTAGATPPRAWLPYSVIGAAITTTIAAPSVLSAAEREAAWGPAATAGTMLTAATAIAIGVGMIVIVVGPSQVASRRSTRTSLLRRLAPTLLVALGGVVLYALTTRPS